MATVTIGGEVVEMSDPCALAEALRRRILEITTGQLNSEVRHGDTAVRKAWSSAELGELRKLLARAEAECARKQGKPGRFAKGIRFRREH